MSYDKVTTRVPGLHELVTVRDNALMILMDREDNTISVHSTILAPCFKKGNHVTADNDNLSENQHLAINSQLL